MRYCTECGTPLQSGVTICPQCGKFIPLSSLTSTDANKTTPAQQGQLPQKTQPPSPPTPSSPVGGYYGTWQNQSASGYPPAPTQQAPLYFPPPRYLPPPKRPGMAKGNTIFLTIIALLIMFSGALLIYYSTTTRPTQLRAQATATVQTIMTAQVQATSTVLAQNNATATAQSQARATATTLQNAYNAATSGAPSLSSPLAAQDDANWDIYSAVGGGGCTFSGSALHASTPQSHSYVPCFAQVSNFSNFAFQVQMTILKGDGGGLIFRADDATHKFYLLRISSEGTLNLSVSRSDKSLNPILEDTSAAIKTGAQTNLITIIVRGSTISIYINKQFADSATDTTYSGGKVGILAFDSSRAADVAFSNANIWTL